MNVKFIIEGMEETGSNGLDAMILAQRDTFFSDVDYIIISDCGWLSRRPALTYGTRGNCYFFAEVLMHTFAFQCLVTCTKTDMCGNTYSLADTCILHLLWCFDKPVFHGINFLLCVCRLKGLSRIYIQEYMEAL